MSRVVMRLRIARLYLIQLRRIQVTDMILRIQAQLNLRVEGVKGEMGPFDDFVNKRTS